MKYIRLQELEVYQLARKLSKMGWEVYNVLDWQTKKNIGNQFIRSIDSTGANIAEGYRRYHYLEQIKFYYNARASLSESCDHWLELLRERTLIKEENFKEMKFVSNRLAIKLNNFIRSVYKSKDN